MPWPESTKTPTKVDNKREIMKVKFTKMQGAGNDYIYVNTFLYPLEEPERLSQEWSRPHTGIGSDGLVLIGPRRKETSACGFSMPTGRKP